MRKKSFILLILGIALFLHPMFASAQTEPGAQGYNGQHFLTKSEVSAVRIWITSNMHDGDIPGMSVVIVQGNTTIYSQGFGYADIETQRPVTPNTLFELGSTSKALTALGILKLEAEGRIQLSDPVQKYLPWFQMRYKGIYQGRQFDGYAPITLEQLLHHTSGIPYSSISDIPIANGSDALEKTVRTQVGKMLDFYPGENFEYASINYDILGLVIQTVSKMPFEEYMQKNILTPLGLNNTYISRAGVAPNALAQGYKLDFFHPQAYNAPVYRGNDPAGYVIMNAVDVAKWLKIQLGYNLPDPAYARLIAESHLPNYTVPPDVDGSSYAAGWRVYHTNGEEEYSHGGSNPNYSSHFLFLPKEQLAVGVLANVDSAYTDTIAEGIKDILLKDQMPPPVNDIYKDVDIISSITFLFALLLCGATAYFSVTAITDFFTKKRRFSRLQKGNLAGICLSIIFILSVAYCIYLLPSVAFSNVSWDFVFVWGPFSFFPAIVLLFASIVLFCIYCQIIFCFPRKEEKLTYPLIVISFASGFGNTIIIFSINEAINRLSTSYTGLASMSTMNLGLVFYFILGLALYIFGQKLIKSKLIAITNEVIYEKRAAIIAQVLNASLDEFEDIGMGNVQTCLNNDTEVMSNTPAIVIGMLTDTVTLLGCFVYLSIVNVYGFLLSLGVILVAVSFYYLAGRSANKLLEQSRDVQNVFFEFINDCIDGFKDLNLHFLKRTAFQQDMLASCDEFKVKRTVSAITFLNAEIIGDLLFILVIGTVAFVFPVLFAGIQAQTLGTYIFIFLYMTVPVNGVLRTIPQVFRVRVSWKRTNDLIKQIAQIAPTKPAPLLDVTAEAGITLETEDLEYAYHSQDHVFRLGPINLKVHSHEILFITGGNGSGKTTLVKLLTGLYQPQMGRILLNGRELTPDTLGEYYSPVFSDFYLFKKLYGIDYVAKQSEIDEMLNVLRMQDTMHITNGEFSTLKLSTGQRKRLALLVSYLEDKHIFVFDEWAADQDPDFRRYFYQEFIHDLKKKGKCVIAITHDDRYFDLADTVIKMEMGKMEYIKLTTPL